MDLSAALSHVCFPLLLVIVMVDPSFHTGQMSKLYLVINRMVRISINSGLGRSSGVAFALYGFSLSSDDGNRKENYRSYKRNCRRQNLTAAS